MATPRTTPLFTRDALAKLGATVGPNSYGVPIVRWWGEQVGLSIGDYCSFADNVQIFLGGNHRSDFMTTYPFASFSNWPEVPGVSPLPETRGNVIIGNDVWVGSRATILSGVTIGHGCIIGTHAVVARSIPAYSVVVGNPGVVVRKRFSEDVIARLLQVRWWDWSREKIERHLSSLLSNDMDAFFAAADRSTAEH